MQKTSVYLLKNRIELIINRDLSTVEYQDVYQRTIKIYNGVDNLIEFDIKNSDQKRVDLTAFNDIKMTVMDQSGRSLPNSPYTIEPIFNKKGIAKVIIPREDLENLQTQWLKYNCIAVQNGLEILLYADTQFGANGSIQLLATVEPHDSVINVYDEFSSKIDYDGNPIYYTSAIACKPYTAVQNRIMQFRIHVTNFAGVIWLEATKQGVITNEAFKKYGQPFGSWNHMSSDLFTGIVPFALNIPIEDWQYFRVCYRSPATAGMGAKFEVIKNNNQYNVQVIHSGTGYNIGSMIKIPGYQLGGLEYTNDLTIRVTGLDIGGQSPSSYKASGIGAIHWDGVASSGTGTYTVTGSNFSSSIDKVVVSS